MSDAPTVTSSAQLGRLVELRQRDLASLGIRMRVDGVIECFSRDDVRLSLLPLRGELERVRPDEVPAGVIPGVLPVLVTDESGALYPIGARRGAEAEVGRQEIDPDALVPVKVRGASLAIEGGDDNDILLWYELSPQLLGALPSCTRESLLAEIDDAAGRFPHRIDPKRRWLRGAMSEDERRAFDSIIASGPRAQEQCADERQLEEVLEVTRHERWEIPRLAIVLDHATNRGRIELATARRGTAAATLHDIQGKYLRPLADSTADAAGPIDLTFDTETIQPGLYNVRIEAAGYSPTVYRILVR